MLGAAVIFAVGLADDLKEVSAPAKLAGQVLAASVLYFLGVTMFYFRVPFADFIVLSPDLVPLLTVLWVAGMANAVNLIDGLDGLAAGIVALAAGAFFVYGNRLGNVGLLSAGNVGPLLAIITCGVCLGFLPHNFHRRGGLGRPSGARIMMGDAGAMLLGLLMAASTMSEAGRPTSSAGRRTSSSPRCSSRSSSWACPCSTPPSPWCAGRPGAGGSRRRTRTTSTTASCAWATATGGPW